MGLFVSGVARISAANSFLWRSELGGLGCLPGLYFELLLVHMQLPVEPSGQGDVLALFRP